MEDDAWESSTDVLLDRCKYSIRFYFLFYTSEIKCYLEISIVLYQLSSGFFLFYLNYTVNADLSLKINENNLSASPFTEGGFAMMWTGVRANYGVKGGKVAYEVKVHTQSTSYLCIYFIEQILFVTKL